MSMIPASKKSKRTNNPIRNIVDNLNPPQNHPKKLLNLALGDPTVHGNLQCPKVLTESIKNLLSVNTANGYIASSGSLAAKRAIAQYNSTPGYNVSEDDVIIASGCSGAIDLVLSGLVNEGDNILVPQPAFPLYQVITESMGGRVKYYPLKAEAGWECDVEAMDAQVDANTKAILINNPSNPCGSNFSADHLLQIAAVARKHRLMIIADEIYGRCVFDGQFFPMHLYSGDVPVVSVGGLAKEFVVPGWRVGWLIFHDKSTNRLHDYKTGVKSLTQITLGASSLLQAALPHLLCPGVRSKDALSLKQFSENYMSILRNNTQICMEEALKCREISVIQPSGAMYAMLKVDIAALKDIKDDAEFARKVLEEENLFMLPGSCFNMPNFVRLVICPPPEVIQEAFERLRLFCDRHRLDDMNAEEMHEGEEGEKGAEAEEEQQKAKRRRTTSISSTTSNTSPEGKGRGSNGHK